VSHKRRFRGLLLCKGSVVNGAVTLLYRASHSLNFDHLRTVCFPFTAIARVFFWSTDYPVTNERGEAVLGVCEYDHRGMPDTALISVNPDLTRDNDGLLLGTLAHELGHAIFDVPGWRTMSCQTGLFGLVDDRKHLGAEIGLVAVLHTWGQTLQHHPHIHCVVPGGGPSPDGARWIACRPGFFLPVRVLSRLFLDELRTAFEAGQLGFCGDLADLAKPAGFARRLRDLRRVEWVVYAKPPFGGPEQVLAYLGRYTHRVAIANSRLVTVTEDEVAFRWKDHRHHGKSKVMAWAPTSSSAASCSTPCRTAFIAFVTTASSPMAIAPRSSPSAASCWPLRRRLSCQHRPSRSKPPSPSIACPCCGGAMVTFAILLRPSPRRPSFLQDTS
jgi:hypothetical protein